MRTTQSTRQALARLTTAAGVQLTREGKHYVVHLPQVDDLPPLSKNSAAALAYTVSSLRGRPDWEQLREATRYDPGVRRWREGGTVREAVDVPHAGLAMWEQDELARLAVTNVER